MITSAQIVGRRLGGLERDGAGGRVEHRDPAGQVALQRASTLAGAELDTDWRITL